MANGTAPYTHGSPAMDPFYFDLQDAIIDIDDVDYLTSLGDAVTLPPAPGSAFAAYQEGTSLEPLTMSRGGGRCSSSGGANVHRRMFRYLRRIGDAAAAAASAGNAVAGADPEPSHRAGAETSQAPRGSTRFRHIMRERLRRERLSQGFADLHALLPPGASKGGKNDIVGAAACYIKELEGRKRRLSARNDALIEQVARTGSSMVVNVRAEIEQHSVAVDVFGMVLQRLKAMEELRVIGIRSCFDGGGMWMNVAVHCCQVPSPDVGKAITNALTKELEENALGMQVPRSTKPAFSCQVERGVPTW